MYTNKTKSNKTKACFKNLLHHPAIPQLSWPPEGSGKQDTFQDDILRAAQ